MKTSALALAAQLVSSAVAFKLVQRENPRVVSLDIQRRNVVDPIAHDRLRRRQKTVQQTLDNLETLYFANASLGTPPQNLRLHIDTGSSDLWANADDSRLCTDRGGERCRISGTYDANSSSTYEYVNSLFNISYVDGSGASGDYAKDNFRFGGKTIEGLQFGIGYSSTSAEGILGIGYAINEVQVNRAGGKPYDNLPLALKTSGDVTTNAYSLWLNDLDASTGSILFGGVDTEKYTGSLSILPIIPHRGGVYAEFIIALTGLGQNGKQGSIFSDQAVPVLLDSGSSLMYLPDNIVQSLYTAFDAQYDSRQGAAFVDCSLGDKEGSIEFTFSGPTISVRLSELVIVGAYSAGQPVCILGIAPAGNSIAVLGDTFLRSAYVVYHLDNNEIALAQTTFNATRSSVEEIQSGDDGIPNASVVPNAVSTVAIGTGGGRISSPTINPAAGAGGGSSTGASMPMATPNPWLGAGAAVAGAGIMMGFNGF